MAPFYLSSIPGDVWPGIPRSEVSQLWTMFLELERTQWLDPIAILDGQLAQIRSLLAHASQHVPHYQHMMRHSNLKPDDVRTLEDFQRIPFVTRQLVQQHPGQFIATSLPVGTIPTTTMRTSGTSGMPIEVRQTNLVNLWWFAFHLRDLAWCGVDLRGSLAVIRGLGYAGANHQKAMEGYKQPYWNDQFSLVVENGPAYVMDIHQEPRRQLQWLLRVQPNYLLSYPPNLEHLAGLLTESGQKLDNLRSILTIGETLTDEARGVIEAGFGVPVKTTYSCVEAGYLASPCPEGHGLHVHAENMLLEVLNDAGESCEPGETGRVVLTTLQNFLMPLIRYEIMDAATVGPSRCPCGRGAMLLTQVEGKRRPQFRMADGRRKDSGFLVRELRKLGGYHQHQIVQQANDHLFVRLVLASDQAWQRREAMAAQIVASAQMYFETRIRVDVQFVDRLEMTTAGKIRDVIVMADEMDTR